MRGILIEVRGFVLAWDFLVTVGAVVLRSTAVVRVAEQIYFVWA